MGLLESLKKNLPDLILDLVPGGDVVRTVARTIAGAADDEEAEARIQKDPALMVELQKVVLVQAVEKVKAENDRYRAETERLQAEMDAVKEVNATMRAEAEAPRERWWVSAWRPFWGAISALAFLAVCVAIGILAYAAIAQGKTEAMAIIPGLVSAFAALFAIPGAILGVASWHRGKMQRAKAGEGLTPEALTKAAEAVRGLVQKPAPEPVKAGTVPPGPDKGATQ